ncbi:phosphorylase family protein [Helicobacter sp. T3_23-1056]
MLVCAGRNENLCYATPIGVGLVEASLGLARLLLGGAREVENIIFVGSAGAYSKEILIGDMFFSVEATQIESSFLKGGSYTPIDNVVKMEEVDFDMFGVFLGKKIFCDRNSAVGNVAERKNMDTNVSYETFKTLAQQNVKKVGGMKGQIKSAVVNSSNYITTDESVAKQMANAGILLENIEFFAVMKVAQTFGVPAMGIFCVTNYCDENAHKDFLENHSEAKSRLEDLIQNILPRSCENK